MSYLAEIRSYLVEILSYPVEMLSFFAKGSELPFEVLSYLVEIDPHVER